MTDHKERDNYTQRTITLLIITQAAQLVSIIAILIVLMKMKMGW